MDKHLKRNKQRHKRKSPENKIKDEGVKFIVITVLCSILVSFIIIFFIRFQSSRISRPIQGIIDFTYKLNSEENSEEVLKDIDSLEEGTDQIKTLVLAYKELAKSLINKKNTNNKRQEEEQNKEYPPNELARIDRSILDQYLDLIPISISK